MKTAIRYCDVHVPRDSFSVEDYVNQIDPAHFTGEITRDDVAGLLRYSMGVDRVYVADRKEEAELFSRMLEEYFQKEGGAPEDIDLVIYSRGNSVAIGDPWDYTDAPCVNVPYYLQNKFKLANAQIFNVEQECAGTIVALMIADSFISGGKMKKVLVLSSNFFESPLKRLMGGMILVSDGLGVMEVSAAETGLTVVDFLSRTDGEYSKVMDLSKPENAPYIIQSGTAMMQKILEKNGLTLDGIQCIVPQNISKNSWNYYCELLGCGKEKIYLNNIGDGGHMGDVDIIRNLSSLLKDRGLKPGQHALLYGLGTGTSWNTCLLKAE